MLLKNENAVIYGGGGEVGGAGGRHVVGALEIAGAVGLLVSRLSGLATLGLAGLMAGAATTDVFVLGTGPLLPLGILLVSALVAGGCGRRPRPASSGAETSARVRGDTRGSAEGRV